MYKQGLALDTLQELICCKIQPTNSVIYLCVERKWKNILLNIYTKNVNKNVQWR